MKKLLALLFLGTVALSIANASTIDIGGFGAPSYKEAVANVAALPPTSNSIGDTRVTLDTVDIYIWDGAAWQIRSGSGGSSGITSLNGLMGATQTFAVGTAGTDFAISSATTVHTFNLPTASAVNRGALSSANWTTFNNKEPAITATTSADYYRGDKTFQPFAAAAQTATISQVITNGVTTKSPSEDAVFDALALKQNLLVNSAGLAAALTDETGTGFAVFSISPALTGSPTAPTQTAADNSTKIATTAYADSAVTASIVQTIINGDTTHASSSDALFDALALKENLANKDSTTTLGTSNTLYPTQNAVKVYADTKVLRQPITFSQIVNVNYISGSDVACPATPCGDGSIDKPFKTIVNAMTSITDSTNLKPYAIMFSGRQIESANIGMKAYVSIVGTGQRTSTIDMSGFNIVPDAGCNATECISSLKDFVLGGGGVDYDFAALGGAFQSGGLIIENLVIDGALDINGRNLGGVGDFVEIYNTVIYNGGTVDSAYFISMGGEFANAFSITNSQAFPGAFISINGTAVDSSLTIDSNDLSLKNIAYGNGATITTVGTVGLTSFRGLPPVAQRTLSGGTTVTFVDQASIQHYSPTTPADWSATPSDLQQALDTLAADVAASGTGDVTGPAASVDSEVAIYNGTTGKIIKRATGTGVAHLTSGVLSTSAVILTSEVSGVLPVGNGGYTAAQARTDVLASTITNGDLTHAPDGNSVFDALALKQDAINFAVFPFSIIPDVDVTRSLGSASKQWNEIYTDSLIVNAVTSSATLSVLASTDLTIGGTNIILDSPSMYPTTDLGTAIGDPTHRIAVTYTNDVSISNHIITTGSAPSATPNANAGTSATCNVSGNDVNGSITLVTGSAAWAAGAQCAITFDTAYNVAPKCALTATNGNAAAAFLNVYISKSTTALTVNFVNPDNQANTITWDYHCAEAN